MTVQLYSAVSASVGRFWVTCQDANDGDGEAVRRLMCLAKGSPDPVVDRLAQAARNHLAIIAQRTLRMPA